LPGWQGSHGAVIFPGGRKPAYVAVKVGRGPRKRRSPFLSYVIEITCGGRTWAHLTGVADVSAYEAKVRSGDYPHPPEQLGMPPTSRGTKAIWSWASAASPDRALEVGRACRADSHGRAIGTVSNLIVNRASGDHHLITPVRMSCAICAAFRRSGRCCETVRYIEYALRRADGLEVYRLK
jgi:hypothetical protein